MQTKKKSWFVICLALFFIWPLGYKFLKERMSSDGKEYLVGQNLLWGFGFFLVILGAAGYDTTQTEAAETNPTASFLMATFFVIGGIFLLYKAFQNLKTVKKYKQYLSLQQRSQFTSITEVAQALGKDYSEAEKDIRFLIEQNMLGDVILMKDGKLKNASGLSDIFESKTVECPACGAKNTLDSTSNGVCEYCGNPLNISQ